MCGFIRLSNEASEAVSKTFKRRYLHQTSVGPALFFQFLVLLNVFLETGLVFLQLGAKSTLVLGLVIGLVVLSIFMMVVVEDFLKEILLVLIRVLGICPPENSH